MLGAIVGDVIGSTREFRPVKSKGFRLFEPASSFTDDSAIEVTERYRPGEAARAREARQVAFSAAAEGTKA